MLSFATLFSTFIPPISCLCYREELTPCCICFFYFNPCSPFFMFTKRTPSIYNGLPWGTFSLCLNFKPKSLRSGPWTPVDGYRKKLTHLLPRLAIPGDICEINGLFTLLPHLSLLYSIKEPGIQTPKGGYFETLVYHLLGLPAFQIKSYSLSQYPVSWLIGLLYVSRASLDSVTPRECLHGNMGVIPLDGSASCEGSGLGFP